MSSGATELSSDDAAYTSLPSFRALVELGWPAVPHMIEKLRTDEEAHFLIHALAEITGEHPLYEETGAGGRPPERPLGNQAEAAAWIAWWEARERTDAPQRSNPP